MSLSLSSTYPDPEQTSCPFTDTPVISLEEAKSYKKAMSNSIPADICPFQDMFSKVQVFPEQAMFWPTQT